MIRHLVILVGVLAILIMGWLVIYPTAERIEAALEVAANDAVEAEGLAWVTVHMQGQTAIMSGTAPSTDAQAAARDAVISAAWPGGPIFGGIVGVEDQSIVAPPMAPFLWRASLSTEGTVRLEGGVPTEEAQAALLEAANGMFPAGVEDRMQLASGAPKGNWQAAALKALNQLAVLSTGVAEIKDSDIRLSGTVGDGTDGAAVKNSLAELPDGYSGYADIEQSDASEQISNDQPQEEAAASEEIAAARLPQPPQRRLNPSQCQSAIDKVVGGTPVRFDFGRNAIQSDSFELLNEVAQVLTQCEGVKVRIGGHTDNQGSDSYNKLLSTKRAESVRDYLADKGVSSTQMVAIGYGATRPIASNASLPGRARNRRISFEIFQ